MNILLDTQIAIWWQYQPERVSPQAIDLIRHQADSVWVSRASLWEMAIKIGLGKLRLSLPKFIRQLEHDAFELLPITNAHVLEVAELEFFDDHRDPFDRFLVAQSRSEPLLLVTADSKLVRYGQSVRLLAP